MNRRSGLLCLSLLWLVCAAAAEDLVVESSGATVLAVGDFESQPGRYIAQYYYDEAHTGRVNSVWEEVGGGLLHWVRAVAHERAFASHPRCCVAHLLT
jgi:hypothetical protein